MAQSTGAGDFRPLANMQSLSTVLAKPSARRTCQLIPATRSGGALLAGCGRKKMVPRGLEPRTLRLLAVRSNQLSYETSGGYRPGSASGAMRRRTTWRQRGGWRNARRAGFEPAARSRSTSQTLRQTSSAKTNS